MQIMLQADAVSCLCFTDFRQQTKPSLSAMMPVLRSNIGLAKKGTKLQNNNLLFKNYIQRKL